MPARARPARRHKWVPLGLCFALFALPLFVIHLPLLHLPFFWDELGQFIPTALDLFRHGAWIAHSTTPNVHPPGVEAYLVLWYGLFGYSIVITRVAMLVLGSFGLLLTFLLAIRLSRGTAGAPAFLPPLLLLASPLFFTQSMMAQLDMPAMVFTLLALLLFLREQYALAAAASVVLVLTKETGLVVPFVFFLALVVQKQWKRAGYFVAPAAALGLWLIVLHNGTGYWLGNPGFAHYNVAYALHPVHVAFSFVRRFYYLFIAEFRWIGLVALLLALRNRATRRVFDSPAWRVTIAVAALQIVLVSVLGGAELERYLLPILPLFYIAVGVALSALRTRMSLAATTALAAGLVVCLFWNPPYPFPYEDNLAMVDFVHLQQKAARFAERNLSGKTIATAWPYTSALEHPVYGFVQRPLQAIETNDFHFDSIRAIPASRFDVLIAYTRTWAPKGGAIALPFVRRFLRHFYQWQPEITAPQCASLGLDPLVSWRLHGQQITIYFRTHSPASPGAAKASSEKSGAARLSSIAPPNAANVRIFMRHTQSR
ncbi:MAG TPA: hypothetical protein VF283_07865 [Bryobacteraceae bacterium]